MSTRKFDWDKNGTDDKPTAKAAAKSADTPKATKPRKKKKRRFRWGRLFALLACMVLVCGIGVAAYVATVLKDLPDWDENVLLSDKTTFLYADDGKVFS